MIPDEFGPVENSCVSEYEIHVSVWFFFDI